MSSAQKIIQAAAGNAAGEALYVEDVFSTYLYEGNGSTQAITNGVDLDGEGGLVWIKNRGSGGHLLSDSARSSIGNYLVTNSTNAEANPGNFINSYNSNGFTLGTWVANTSGDDYVSWTFRKAPKFFDVVTYTGDGSSDRQIAHNLGAVPGCIMVKSTSFAESWTVYHRSTGNTKALTLETTAAAYTNSGRWNNTTPTDSVFTVGGSGSVNQTGESFVAYLFAHNDGDGEFGEDADQDIIKCGSFTTDGSYNASVDLGFEPQWIVIKRSDGSANWNLFDSMRGMPAPGLSPTYTGLQNLFPNLSNAEGEANGPHPTATGFEVTSYGAANANYIYIAIRRGPMKTPESGTEVFTPVIGNNLGSAGTAFDAGFPVDLVLRRVRASTADNLALDRLRGGKLLKTNSTDAESTNASFSFDSMEGLQFSSGNNFSTEIGWNFRRTPGFFDVVAYNGDSASSGTGNTQLISHNLGVAPEHIIVKRRGPYGSDWIHWHKDIGAANYLFGDAGAVLSANPTYFFGVTGPTPTEDTFKVGDAYWSNASGSTYIAYLFASVPGVSKVGSYTGNGTSQTIDCGFSTGARFVLLKETNGTSSWIVLDSERGINAGNDPILALNNTNAEYSGDDWIDPVSSGFSLPGAVFNGTGEEYIFLAIA